jgi:hypothetical protein
MYKSFGQVNEYLRPTGVSRMARLAVVGQLFGKPIGSVAVLQ